MRGADEKVKFNVTRGPLGHLREHPTASLGFDLVVFVFDSGDIWGCPMTVRRVSPRAQHSYPEEKGAAARSLVIPPSRSRRYPSAVSTQSTPQIIQVPKSQAQTHRWRAQRCVKKNGN